MSRVVEEAPRAQHRMSIMRYLVPSETVLADPEVAGFFVDGLKSLRAVNNVDKRVIIYGCRGYVMSFAPPFPCCDTGQQRTKLPASRGSLQNIGLIYPPRLGMDAAGTSNLARPPGREMPVRRSLIFLSFFSRRKRHIRERGLRQQGHGRIPRDYPVNLSVRFPRLRARPLYDPVN